MTINLLMFTISFNKRKKTLEEAEREEYVEKMYQQNKEKQITVHHMM
ncbi:YrzI family small protein [Neobacillus cucumis]|uniref:YrzI family protein n=1 Tax=Neobacillus cucumis TaxID=1740721 RepID=A0A2N5HNN0_9BACI|nr:YrzI family small protein [Neobacillus cucumis]PLS07136.1 YrzI family protein [Neobacillus cucumis]